MDSALQAAIKQGKSLKSEFVLQIKSLAYHLLILCRFIDPLKQGPRPMSGQQRRQEAEAEAAVVVQDQQDQHHLCQEEEEEECQVSVVSWPVESQN